MPISMLMSTGVPISQFSRKTRARVASLFIKSFLLYILLVSWLDHDNHLSLAYHLIKLVINHHLFGAHG